MAAEASGAIGEATAGETRPSGRGERSERDRGERGDRGGRGGRSSGKRERRPAHEEFDDLEALLVYAPEVEDLDPSTKCPPPSFRWPKAR